MAFQTGKIELSHGDCMAMHGAVAPVFFGILILVLLKSFGVAQRRTQLMAPGRTGGMAAGALERRGLPAGQPLQCAPLATRKKETAIP